MRIVTITRPFGAGGHTVGQEVSKRLGFELIEKQVVDAVAKKAKVSPDWVKAIEKERGNQLINFVNSLVSINFLDIGMNTFSFIKSPKYSILAMKIFPL